MQRKSLSLRTWAFVFAFILGGPAVLWAHAGTGSTPSATSDHQKGRGNGKNGGAAARDKGTRSEAGHPVTGHAAPRSEARYDWSDRDHCRIVVGEYYGRHGLPPGLAKKRALPPGLRKQLRERGHLPPGLERYWVPLPVELERTLPPLPPHHVRRWVDDDLLVIDVRTNFVVSIMAGVFIRR